MAVLDLRRSNEEMIKKLKTEITHVTILGGFNLGDVISSQDLAESTPDRNGTVHEVKVASDINSFRLTNSVATRDALIFGAIGGITYNNVALLKLEGSRYRIVGRRGLGSTSKSHDHAILVPPFQIVIL